MKHLKVTSLFLFLIAASFSLGSCGKDEEPKPEEEAINGVTATFTLEDGSTINYKGTTVGGAIWSLDEDGLNIVSIISTGPGLKGQKNAMLLFGISFADGPGSYPLTPNEFMANPSKLLLPGTEHENWMGFVTGDADGDGDNDGSGTFTITKLTEQRTEGTFSMVMGSDIGEKITVKGKFNCKVTRLNDG